MQIKSTKGRRPERVKDMKKYEWKPIDEMDMEDGTHTCYVTETDNYYVYLTQLADDTWDVEQKRKKETSFVTLVNCKTLTSAKRWVSRYW